MAHREAFHLLAHARSRQPDIGGKVFSSKTRRSANRAAKIFRLSAVNVGQTHTALGAFYRRLASRVGKAKAVTATARKLAVLFYNALRYGMDYEDPGAHCAGLAIVKISKQFLSQHLLHGAP